MAADEEIGERTEEATQARRDDFRRRGQVVQSRELASTLFILAGLLAMLALGRFFFHEIAEIFHHSLGPDLLVAARTGDFFNLAKFAAGKGVLLLLPVAGLALIIGIGSTLLQVGFLNVEDALSPKFEKIDPLEGFKRIVSLKNLSEGIKAFAKLMIIGGIVFLLLKSEIWKIPFFIQANVGEILNYMGTITAKLLGGIGIAMAGLTAMDYLYQRWDMEKRMRMTKQEIKEEHKSREGDPLIKARIRRVQKEMANRRMMEKVPQADVIITNPTHIAVALKYDANLPAPQLIAKGADLIAEKIKALARDHNIPVVENKPLARTIYKTLNIGQVIPRELFVAVAEVLSYVYRLKKRKRRS